MRSTTTAERAGTGHGTAAPGGGRPHGYARYRLDGCRCYVCGLARSRYDERRTKMMTAGTWRPFQALGPVRAHVLALKELGLGDRQIARLADVDRKLVRDVAAGFRHDPQRGNPAMTKVRTETAVRLLAVPLDPLVGSDGGLVDATRTWHLITELQEAGWSKAAIARKGLGCANGALQLSQGKITARNARAIAALHRRVIGDDEGLADVEQSQVDDCDWVVVERAVAGADVRLSVDERRQVVLELARRGMSATAIARHLRNRISGARVRQILLGAEAGDGRATA